MGRKLVPADQQAWEDLSEKSITRTPHSGCKRGSSYVSSSLLQPVQDKTRGATPQSDTNLCGIRSINKLLYVTVTRLKLRSLAVRLATSVKIRYTTSFSAGVPIGRQVGLCPIRHDICLVKQQYEKCATGKSKSQPARVTVRSVTNW